jgi:hypothetical protein
LVKLLCSTVSSVTINLNVFKESFFILLQLERFLDQVSSFLDIFTKNFPFAVSRRNAAINLDES